MQRDDDVEIPSLTLDQDEVSDRRSSTKKTKDKTSPAEDKPSSASKKLAHASKQTNSSHKANLSLVYLFLALIFISFIGVGFWLWQQNEQLRNEIYGAKSEIQNLDHQLIAADVSANKQGQTVEETLKNHDSEIRKLWGVAYDRNRKAIADNASEIKKLQQTLVSLKDTLSVQSERIALQSVALSEVEAEYNKLIPAVSGIDEVVKAIGSKQESMILQEEALLAEQSKQVTQLETVESQLALQAGQSQTQTLTINTLRQELEAVQKKISEISDKSADVSAADFATIQSTLVNHGDAIRSSDAFRTQVNNEILRLRKQINQLVLEQQLSAQ